MWCMAAIPWRHGIDAPAGHLVEENTKARNNGERYATMTAENAVAPVVRQERSRRFTHSRINHSSRGFRPVTVNLRWPITGNSATMLFQT